MVERDRPTNVVTCLMRIIWLGSIRNLVRSIERFDEERAHEDILCGKSRNCNQNTLVTQWLIMFIWKMDERRPWRGERCALSSSFRNFTHDVVISDCETSESRSSSNSAKLTSAMWYPFRIDIAGEKLISWAWLTAERYTPDFYECWDTNKSHTLKNKKK